MRGPCETSVIGVDPTYPPYTYPAYSYSTADPCDHELYVNARPSGGRMAWACTKCGAVIGVTFDPSPMEKLRQAIADAIGDADLMPALGEELDKVELLLQLEEQGIEDARRLIDTAKRMILAVIERSDL